MSTPVWFGRRLTGEGVLSGVNALHDTFSLFLVQCIIILTICRLLGLLGARFKQPKVIFEIIGGILLGPSAIGRNTNYLNTIFPSTSLPLISVVANLGLVLYLFIVGMELDPKLLATHARKAGAIAFMGMAIPFALGIAISRIMFDTLQYANVSFISFFVFIGTAMSITAFPVLARILKEGGLIYTTAGSMAMGAAALNDAAAWCLLVLAISLANAANLGTAGYVFLSVLAVAIVLIVGFRPLFWSLVSYVEAMNSPAMNNGLFCLTLILVFLCAWTTALLGLDAIFGAFIFGLIMPRDSHLFKECNEKIEELVLSLTLPLYFALSGLKTDVTQINTGSQGAMVVLVCFVATIGKYVGAGSAAYFGGMSVRESSVIAALMNTRGLVELIVLNLGVSAGILSTKTFSVMVVMCLVTTFMTCPVVNCIYPVNLRVLASDAERQKLMVDEEAAQEFDDLEEDRGGETLGMIAKGARLGVIVDRMEHLQGIMDLLSCFIPFSQDARLSVTAIKAFEPSMTEKDRFIGLNAEGRLIHVEEENTTLHEAGATPHSETIKLVLDELLPLSMFLRAVGGTVKAYRMRGDPREFPHEIRTLTGKSCNLILFPWRASQYVERLFWGSLRTVAAPVALIVMLDTTLTPTIADIAMGEGVVGEATRNRSQSAAIARSRALSSTSDSENNSVSVMADDRDRISERIRGEVSYATASPVSGMSPTGSPDTSARISRKRLNLTDDSVTIPIQPPPPPPTDGISLNRQSISIKNMLCVVTGSAMCSAVFPIALRFAERGSIAVTLLVTSDRRQFNESLVEALSAFRKATEGVNNITVVTLTTPSSDVESILMHCAEKMYDLIVFGFSDESSSGEDVIPPPARLHRSASIWDNAPVLDGAEMRRQSGVPESLISSPLAHPELGLLGNRLRERGLTSFMMILHEPTVYNRQRRSTMWGGTTLPSSPPTKTAPFASKSQKPNDLFTIAEEKI